MSSAPDLALQVAKAGRYPSKDFNKREQKLLQSMKAYSDRPASVVLADLAPGITPSHIVVAAGKQATVAGSANQTITIAGALITDIAQVTLAVKGATPRTILTGISAAGQINVVMSGDPSTDHTLAYLLLRAAS